MPRCPWCPYETDSAIDLRAHINAEHPHGHAIDPDEFTRPPDHDRRMRQARARAAWELGDPDWADKILLAYMHPERDREVLAEEQA